MGTSSMYSGPKDNKLLPDDYLEADNGEEKKKMPDDDKKIDPDAWKKAKNAMSKYINAKTMGKSIWCKYENITAIPTSQLKRPHLIPNNAITNQIINSITIEQL